MIKPNLKICVLLLIASASAFAQKAKPITICKQTAFTTFKPLPKLTYDCPAGLIESDDKILKLPARIAALNEVTQQLRSLATPAWWQTNIDDLNACEMHGSAGALTAVGIERSPSTTNSIKSMKSWQRCDPRCDCLDQD